MNRVLVASSMAVALAAGPSAFAAGVEVRLGGFFPAANANIFTDASELFAQRSIAAQDPLRTPPGISRGDWDGLFGGAEFSMRVASKAEIGFHVDGYGQTLNTTYREYTHPDGREINQSLSLKFIPVGFSLRLVNSSRKARIAPYLAVGGDLVYYRLEEVGEFVDFYDPNLEIYDDAFYSSGWLPGAHAAAGVRVPLGDDFRFVVEGKYLWTARERMNGDRDLNEIDARGFSVTGGFYVRF